MLHTVENRLPLATVYTVPASLHDFSDGVEDGVLVILDGKMVVVRVVLEIVIDVVPNVEVVVVRVVLVIALVVLLVRVLEMEAVLFSEDD